MGDVTNRASLAENRSIEMAKARIEASRTQVEETVGAMRQHLSSERFQHQMVEIVKDATIVVLDLIGERIHRSGDRMFETAAGVVRQLPVPVSAAAMVGTILLLSGRTTGLILGGLCLGAGISVARKVTLSNGEHD